MTVPAACMSALVDSHNSRTLLMKLEFLQTAIATCRNAAAIVQMTASTFGRVFVARAAAAVPVSFVSVATVLSKRDSREV